MSCMSRHRLANATPHYGIPLAPRCRHSEPLPRFTTELRRAGIACATQVTNKTKARSPRAPSTPWPVAFALMLFAANVATPAAFPMPRLPRMHHPRQNDPDASHSMLAYPTQAAVEVTAVRESEPDDVVRTPVPRALVRSSYTFSDVMRAVAAGDEPFRKFGDAICDAHAILSGTEIDPRTCATQRRITRVIDAATNLMPQVQQLRVPSYLAGLIADGLNGIRPSAEQIAATAQLGDPRTFTEHGALRSVLRVINHPLASVRENAAGPSHTGGIETADSGDADDAGHTGLADHAGDTVDAADANEADRSLQMLEAQENAPLSDEAQGEAAAAAPHDDNESGPSPVDMPIENELEFLQGYQHVLARDPLLPGHRPRMLFVDDHQYIAGDAGYYRVTRGHGVDHWFVDAPRGSGARAQVPVTYDAASGQWRAHPPLRLCGGGCAPSREATPDSIALQSQQIAEAVSHLPEEHVRIAIERAFDDVGKLHLLRTNRDDLRPMRDNSITRHRAALSEAMKRIDPDAPLFAQQREAAFATTTHYYWHRDSEAFCQENAEVLFHYLLENGVPPERIRMITVQPRNRAPHVMVLYTESELFIDLLELATPQPAVPGYIDGIDDASFSGWLYMTRESSLFFDPWSTVKATSFARTNSEHSLMDTLNAALVDAGLRPGGPYVVSITRPLRGRHTSTATRGSGVSMGSAGSSDTSGSSGPATGLFAARSGLNLARPSDNL